MTLPTAKSIRCPHCGFQGPPAEECPQCGIVYTKYRGAERPSSSWSAALGHPTAAPKRFTLLPWLIGLLAVVSVAILLNTFRPEESLPDATSQPSSEVPAEAPDLPPSMTTAPRPVTPAPEPVASFEPAATPLEPQDASAQMTAEPQRSLSASYSWYEGASGFQSGVAEATREGKALAIYFYTDWCPYCRELESELLTRAKVEEFLKYVVKIRVNPEQGARERAIADQYGVRGYPSLFMQSAPGASPRKIRRTDRNGLKSPEAFVATLERAAR